MNAADRHCVANARPASLVRKGTPIANVI